MLKKENLDKYLPHESAIIARIYETLRCKFFSQQKNLSPDLSEDILADFWLKPCQNFRRALIFSKGDENYLMNIILKYLSQHTKEKMSCHNRKLELAKRHHDKIRSYLKAQKESNLCAQQKTEIIWQCLLTQQAKNSLLR